MIRHLRSRNGRPGVVCSIVCLQKCAGIWLMIAALCKYVPSPQRKNQRCLYATAFFFILNSSAFFSPQSFILLQNCTEPIPVFIFSSQFISLAVPPPSSFLSPLHCHCSVLAAVPLPWRVQQQWPLSVRAHRCPRNAYLIVACFDGGNTMSCLPAGLFHRLLFSQTSSSSGSSVTASVSQTDDIAFPWAELRSDSLCHEAWYLAERY